MEDTMHQSSSMELSQIEKKSKKYQSDIDGIFTVEQSIYHNGDSNNTINNTKNNMDPSTASAGRIPGQPEEESKVPAEFVF